jgi:hypothetical protein
LHIFSIHRSNRPTGLILRLKSDFEVFVLVVGGDFFDFDVPNIAAKIFFYVPDTIVDCLRRTLEEHLNGPIRQIVDKTGQSVAIGYVKNGKAEADTLNLAGENYMLGYLAHYGFYINSK